MSMQTHAVRKAMQAVGRRSELIGVAIVGVLLALAFLKTDWTPYSRHPHEITDRVSEAGLTLNQSVWPESERSRFLNSESVNVAAVVARHLSAEIPLHDLRPAGPFTRRPGQDLRVRQPEFERVQHMLASSGRLLIELRPAHSAETATASREEAAAPADEVIPWLDELRSRNSTRDPRRAATSVPYDQYDQLYPPDAGYAAGAGVLRKGHGYPYVSVRGLFDVSAQVSAYVDAIHRSAAEAEKRLVLINFELERQTWNERQGDWSDWEPVDVQVFRDVALSANGFEPDVVSSEATDAAITCPLPMRVTGRWQTQATHPLLQRYDLSGEELERESAFHEAILELLREQQQPRRAEPLPKGGFADLLLDARGLQHDLFDPILSGTGTGAGAGTYTPTPARRGFRTPAALTVTQQGNPAIDELVRRIADKIDPRQSDRDLREWVRNRMNRSQSRYVLFRYLDFDVEPGATYRYQVRLELLNPNFGRSLSAAGGDAHVVEGETRLTPWSEPTDPVTVRENVRYFLTALEEVRHRPHPWARLNVFQYDTELGTVVRQELPVELGQKIEGTARAVLLDPAAGTRKEDNYTFRTSDILLDVLPDLAFDRNLHADLQLPVGSIGHAHLPEFALVLARDRLHAIDPLSQSGELARQEDYLRAQNDQLSHLRAQSGGWQNEHDQMIFEELFGQPASGDIPSPQPRQRNMLQRR